MKTMKFTFWKDGDYYLGFWNDYPDYQTQGMSKDELVSNLKDLLADLQSGEVPYIRSPERWGSLLNSSLLPLPFLAAVSPLPAPPALAAAQ
jgi:hypothetical protein